MIIFCEHAVETLTYFSRQIAQEFARLGYEIFWMDFEKIGLSAWKLRQRMQSSHTQAVLITFNAIGLSGEEQLWDADAQGLPSDSIWEQLGIRCLNILVDHPIYYYEALRHPVPDLVTFCIDRDHAAYMRRFYPNLQCVFLPLAGNLLLADDKEDGAVSGTGSGCWRAACDGRDLEVSAMPLEKERPAPVQTLDQWLQRPYPLVFTANYVPVANIEKQLDALEPEYRDFYYEIIEAFVRDPGRDLLSGMEGLLMREMPDLTQAQLCEAMSNMPAVDLWIRTYFREKTVRILAEAGMKVYVFGKDWDLMACKCPQNVIHNGGMTDSAACVRAAAGAKLALNTMPWFKDGAHDRVFTAMLQGAAALTDPSIYLTEQFTDQKELFYYDLCRLEQLPELVKGLLKEPERVYAAACSGREAAVRYHTWKSRAEILRNYASLPGTA